MLDIFIDALIDSIKLLPYIFITFIIIEFIEHKLTKKSEDVLIKYKRFGPILGGILGGFPECGFSAMAASLFSGKIITMGTLIAVFLSTSDEMIALMIGQQVNVLNILKIIGFKILIGIIIGIIVDLIYRPKKENEQEEVKHICEDANCHCENGIFKSSLKHTFSTIIYVFIANLLIDLLIHFIGIENLESLLSGKHIATYFISSLIGLIPNCAASIAITQVYLSGLISIGVCMSGLLTGSGMGILLLFKNNKSIKENISILSIIYIVGAITGMILDLIVNIL